MRRDWFAPLVWVPAAVLLLGGLAWILVEASSVSDQGGAICGSAWHWKSAAATTTGGEVSVADRAAEDHACHDDAVQRMRVADCLLLGALGVAVLAGGGLAVRERRGTGRKPKVDQT